MGVLGSRKGPACSGPAFKERLAHGGGHLSPSGPPHEQGHGAGTGFDGTEAGGAPWCNG